MYVYHVCILEILGAVAFSSCWVPKAPQAAPMSLYLERSVNLSSIVHGPLESVDAFLVNTFLAEHTHTHIYIYIVYIYIYIYIPCLLLGNLEVSKQIMFSKTFYMACT